MLVGSRVRNARGMGRLSRLARARKLACGVCRVRTRMAARNCVGKG